MKEPVFDFTMPRYDELPNVGLYLEQVVKFVNETLAVLDVSVTPSMVSNYVKKGYIDRPVKKLYYHEQIAYILFIAVAKQALSMENIQSLFELQKVTYGLDDAYNYFCTELESMLRYVFEVGDFPADTLSDAPFAKKTLRSLVIAVSHIFFLNSYFKRLDK